MSNKFVPKSEFVRNVLTLMTGTSVAQAIPIAISPFLTRIYGPDDFGLYALYTGVALVLAVFATGRYELAIMLPEKEEDAAELMKFSSIITIFISLITFFIILILSEELSILLGNESIYTWLFFLPITILFSGIYQILNYWFNRRKKFTILAKNRVLQNLITGAGQLLFSTRGIGLLFGSIFGQFISLIFLMRKLLNERLKCFYEFNFSRMIRLGKRYINFPKYDVPTTALNVAASQAPNILFATFFTAQSAGFFFLTQRVLQMPISLISNSILDVFKEEASKTYRETGQCKDIFVKTAKWLSFISIIPSLLMFFFVEDLFGFFFGSEWVEAGLYAKILIPSLAFRFIVSPLSFMVYIAEKQKINFFGMLSLFIWIIASFMICDSARMTVMSISLGYCLNYLLYFFYSAKLAKVI